MQSLLLTIWLHHPKESDMELVATRDDTESCGNLEEKANVFSYIFMSWLDRLFKLGATRTLELSDLGEIGHADRANVLHSNFEREFEIETKKDNSKKSLWGVLWRTVGYMKLFTSIFLFLLSAAIQFGPVMILTRLVKYFQGVDKYEKWELWVMVSLLFVFPVFGSICLAHSNAIMSHIGAQIRNTLIDAIYRKSLRISPYYKQTISTGRIITMFSDDTSQIRAFLFFLNNSIGAPLQIGTCLYLIYRQVGVATFVGLGYTIFTLPISGITFGLVFKMRVLKMKDTDARVKLMNEVMNGIRIIKYYAWENAFIKKIRSIRKSELYIVAKMGYIFQAVFGIFLLGATQIQTVLIFLTYVALGNQLDAATAFTTLTLFGLMTSPFIFLPYGLQQYNQSSISMKRIMEFLTSEDIAVYIKSVEIPADGVIIEFKDACISWTPKEVADAQALATVQVKEDKSLNDKEYQVVERDIAPVLSDSPEDFSNKAIHTLRNLSIKIKQGQLVAIVGSVGCGKSSFLSALLGEMHMRSGEIIMAKKIVDGQLAPLSIAYCDQRPWIVNSTLQGNILFGHKYDEERFRKAVFGACLDDDLSAMPAGDLTEIGERGINLSGGQKARVSLARAIYSDADIFLLDDPISAVDAHVGMHIIDNCLKGVLKDKTRLLVTHHLPILPKCDLILILDTDGTVKASGTYSEIMNSGIDVEQYLGSKDLSASISVNDTKKDGNKDTKKTPVEETKNDEKKAELISKEERSDGSVAFSTYLTFIEYGGWFPFILTVFCQFACQVLGIEANFWLADWGKETSINNYVLRSDMSISRNIYWFRGYAGLQMASIFCLFVSRMALNYHRSEAARKLHENVLLNILALPVSFFDITPVGRIINRFSQDMATIDEEIAQSMSQVIGMGGGVLGCLGAIAGSTKGTFLILAVPLGVLYSRFQTYFRKSNTAIARIDAISRSPIYADFSQTLSGTQTIRAYGQQDRFILGLEDSANKNTVPGVLQQIAGQWLAIRLDIIGALIMFFMGALTVSLQKDSFIPAGYLALGLSYSIQLTALLKMAVRVSSTLEAQFNSVERVKYYSDLEGAEGKDEEGKRISINEEDIEMQEKKVIPTSTIPNNWPHEGKIRFENVELRYRDGPLVLKGVSFDVAAKEKIGIAGRTGCGKSSLMVALFRIEPLAAGRIIIDDIDIASIPLQALRKKLCIIPQDPVMFSSTVRFNLDPFDEFSDDQIFDVLRDVSMYDHIQSLPNKILEMVAESGDNFSAGQRQLICVARALLRKPKILVMDEATASIDTDTDELIQLMIRTKFAECTVLTIAHRLHTIVDSSKILVMDSGLVGEYDLPKKLLDKQDGIFKQLWNRHVSQQEGK